MWLPYLTIVIPCSCTFVVGAVLANVATCLASITQAAQSISETSPRQRASPYVLLCLTPIELKLKPWACRQDHPWACSNSIHKGYWWWNYLRFGKFGRLDRLQKQYVEGDQRLVHRESRWILRYTLLNMRWMWWSLRICCILFTVLVGEFK